MKSTTTYGRELTPDEMAQVGGAWPAWVMSTIGRLFVYSIQNPMDFDKVRRYAAEN